MRFRKHFYLYPDGVEGGPAPAEGAQPAEGNPAPAGAEGAPAAPVRPKYLDQVSPAKRDSEDYKSLYEYGKLEDLADAMISTRRELNDLKKSQERAIIVPEKDDAEGVKAFYKKLGVPETADGYELKSLAMLNKDSDKEMAKMVREACFSAKLNGRQAEHVGALMVNLAQKGLTMAKEQADLRRQNADSDLMASYTDITSDADRKNAADRDRAGFNAFAEESGLKELFDDIGISYNPKAVKGIAAYARKHAGATINNSITRPQPNSGKKTSYGDGFYKHYGINKE